MVVCQVGSASEAAAAEKAGAEVVIAQGREAGGHVRGTQPLDQLLPEVLAATDVPVLAAGGITDGAGLATMLALGAQGVVLGTALMATHESFAHNYHKRCLVEARDGDTVLTDVFHVNWPIGAPVRVLKNSVTRGERGDPFAGTRTVIGEEEGRAIYLFSTDSPLRSMTGDFEAMALYAGEGVGRIDAVTGAGERLRAIVAEATALLDAGSVAPAEQAEPAEPASPACSAHEMDDAYMGYADRDTLLAALNELLEAERAGARVALRSAADATDAQLAALIGAIQRDEARWCGVLTRAIQALDGTPSRRTGAFYEKAMAIEDLPQRLAFLNRGQGWVVRRLRAVLPQIRDDRLHGALAAMLAAHERNIERTAPHLPSTRA
jgi:nitronate monooxygenase